MPFFVSDLQGVQVIFGGGEWVVSIHVYNPLLCAQRYKH